MNRITKAATMAWIAVMSSLLTVMAGGQTASKANTAVIEQAGYFALPGKEEDVYQARIQASDLLEKLGLPRGIVLRRHGNSDTLPDVLWQIEFPDDAARQRNLKIRLESPEFAAVRDRMKTLISRGELSVWEKN